MKIRLEDQSLQLVRLKGRAIGDWMTEVLAELLARARVASVAGAAALLRATRDALTPGPSRRVRRIWQEQLEDLGAMVVRDRMDGVELLNTDRHAKVRFIDAGVTHGKHRFPTRSYVEAWLGDDEADLRPWRVMVLVALAFAGVAAAILFGVTGEIPI